MSYASDQETGAAAAGFGNPGQFGNYTENVKRLHQVGIDDINARGGIGGCKAELALHDIRSTGSNTYDAESEQECIDFAEDQRVFAVYPTSVETQTLVTCLSKRGVPVILPNMGQPIPTNKSDYASGAVYTPSLIAWDRLGPEPDLLHAAGFFGTNAKVGIMITDDGRGINKRLAGDWKARLSRLHVPVVSTFTSPPLTTFTGASALAQNSNNAAVQFRGAGVTHVMFTPMSGGGSFFFIKSADSQAYHPRLAIDSTNRPEIFYDSPEASKVGAMAVSFQLFDVSAQAQKPPVAATAARTRCAKLYKDPAAAAGVAPEQFYTWCDTLNMLAAALKAANGKPTAAGLREGVARLGSTFEVASGFGNARFAKNGFDGGHQVRVMKWNSSKNGWEYATGVRELG